MNISRYFTLDEVEHSTTALRLGIDNSLPPKLIENAIHTAKCMDVVRGTLNRPILVESWYRCLILNRALKSADTSDHLRACAVDWTCPEFGSPLEICKFLCEYKDKLNWKQLILEHTWIHISFPFEGQAARKEVLTLLAGGGYAVGITDKYGNSLE